MKTLFFTFDLIHDIVLLLCLVIYCLVGGAKKLETKIATKIWEG